VKQNAKILPASNYTIKEFSSMSRFNSDSETADFIAFDDNFKCVPKNTSNFDVFRYVNKQLTDDQARKIWDYYRELFINTKLFGDEISEFRQTLQRFIEDKLFTDNDSKEESINSYIGLARWLELQYTCDNTIDQLSADWSKTSLKKSAERVLGTVPFNNYVSYFTPNVEKKLRNIEDYDTRQLKVRSVYEYTHKQIRWYICNSEYGAVKMWAHTKHTPFLDLFEPRIKKGLTISVVTSKILCNIDQSTPYIKIDNFFLRD
jgi:hypothetical protein